MPGLVHEPPPVPGSEWEESAGNSVYGATDSLPWGLGGRPASVFPDVKWIWAFCGRGRAERPVITGGRVEPWESWMGHLRSWHSVMGFNWLGEL